MMAGKALLGLALLSAPEVLRRLEGLTCSFRVRSNFLVLVMALVSWSHRNAGAYLRLVLCFVVRCWRQLAAAEHDYGGYYGVITDPHQDPVPEEPVADDPSPPILGVNFGRRGSNDLTENDLEESTGVVVNEVYPDTAAEEMGLQEGDLIIQIGETRLIRCSRSAMR